MRKIVINALQYKKNNSGIGVMIRELFSRYARITERRCELFLLRDIDDFPPIGRAVVENIPWTCEQGLRRTFFQLFVLGPKHCRDAILLTTDAKIPLLLPKSCTVVPLITDLAVYHLPETYQTSRVLLWKLQYRVLCRRAQTFLAISEFTKRDIMETLHIPAERIHVVPCASDEAMHRVTDETQLRSIREKYQLPERFALFVGNTNPRKNLMRLLRAFDAAKERGLSHELVIAGGGGWKFDRGNALAEVRHKESVHFIGFVDDKDMPALYSASDGFLFPTLYEGFGIPVIEAQRCGTPVLTSGCTSLPEVGGDGALYVDPYDTDGMTNGILTLLQDKALAADLVEKGYRNAERFSWQASAERLNAIIEEEFH